MTSDIRNHVHRTTREDFLWLPAPREFARMLAAQDSHYEEKDDVK